MKLFEIKRGYYWGVYIAEQHVLLKLSLYRMICVNANVVSSDHDGITVVPIDERFINRIKNTPYRVKEFYKSSPECFYGCAALSDDNSIAGYVGGKKITMLEAKRSERKIFDGEDYFYIKYVYVDPKCRGKKLSALLINKLAQEIRLPLMLNCRTNNFAALKVYRSIGFKSVSVFEQVYCPIIHKGIIYRDEKVDDDCSSDDPVSLQH